MDIPFVIRGPRRYAEELVAPLKAAGVTQLRVEDEPELGWVYALGVVVRTRPWGKALIAAGPSTGGAVAADAYVDAYEDVPPERLAEDLRRAEAWVKAERREERTRGPLRLTFLGVGSSLPLGASFVLQEGDTLIFGRSRECRMVIEENDVARRHGRVTLRPEGPLLQDHGTTNGTYLNGQRIQEAPLKVGDIFALSASQHFRLDGEAGPAWNGGPGGTTSPR